MRQIIHLLAHRWIMLTQTQTLSPLQRLGLGRTSRCTRDTTTMYNCTDWLTCLITAHRSVVLVYYHNRDN